MVCGVCVGSLANAGYESMDEIDRDEIADKKREEDLEREKWRLAKRRQIWIPIGILVVGVGLMVWGFWLATVRRDRMGLTLLVLGMMVVGGSIGLQGRGFVLGSSGDGKY